MRTNRRPVNKNWEPGLVNRNWGPRPGAKQRTGDRKYTVNEKCIIMQNNTLMQKTLMQIGKIVNIFTHTVVSFERAIKIRKLLFVFLCVTKRR